MSTTCSPNDTWLPSSSAAVHSATGCSPAGGVVPCGFEELGEQRGLAIERDAAPQQLAGQLVVGPDEQRLDERAVDLQQAGGVGRQVDAGEQQPGFEPCGERLGEAWRGAHPDGQVEHDPAGDDQAGAGPARRRGRGPASAVVASTPSATGAVTVNTWETSASIVGRSWLTIADWVAVIVRSMRVAAAATAAVRAGDGQRRTGAGGDIGVGRAVRPVPGARSACSPGPPCSTWPPP